MNRRSMREKLVVDFINQLSKSLIFLHVKISTGSLGPSLSSNAELLRTYEDVACIWEYLNDTISAS